MCDLCRGLTDGCPNCDNAENDYDDFDDLLDQADFLNDVEREREDE